METKTRKSVYFIAVLGAALGGLTFLGAKIALTELDAIEVLTCRWTLSLCLFLVLLAVKGIRVDYRGKPIWAVVLMAFIQPCINTICETVGVDLTTTSESAIVYAMIPMTVALISVVFLKQRVTKMLIAGILLSFAGVIIAIGFGDSFSLGGKADGYIWLLGMVVTGAAFIVYSGYLADKFSPMERTFAMAVVGAVWFNVLNVIRGNGVSSYVTCFQEPQVGLAVLFLGAIGSFTCYIIMNYVLSHIPAPQASTIQINVVAITGVVSGILVQGDSFGWYTVVGLAIVVAGVAASNSRDPEKDPETVDEDKTVHSGAVR